MNPFPLALGAVLFAAQVVGSTPPRDTVAVNDSHQEPVSQLLAELTARTDTKITRLADGGMEIKDQQKEWIFVPPHYAAYPAVVEYHLVFGKGKDGLSLGAEVQCDVKGSACDELARLVGSNVETANQPGHESLSQVGYSPLIEAGKNCPSTEVHYPREALPQAAQGTVVLLVDVGANGPKKYLLERSSRNQYLDEAAMTAVKTWCFRRPESSDASAEYWIRVPIHFKLH